MIGMGTTHHQGPNLWKGVLCPGVFSARGTGGLLLQKTLWPNEQLLPQSRISRPEPIPVLKNPYRLLHSPNIGDALSPAIFGAQHRPLRFHRLGGSTGDACGDYPKSQPTSHQQRPEPLPLAAQPGQSPSLIAPILHDRIMPDPPAEYKLPESLSSAGRPNAAAKAPRFLTAERLRPGNRARSASQS